MYVLAILLYAYVNVFWKTEHSSARPEIHLLPVCMIDTLVHYPETPITRQ